jgi:hypothetical protein
VEGIDGNLYSSTVLEMNASNGERTSLSPFWREQRGPREVWLTMAYPFGYLLLLYLVRLIMEEAQHDGSTSWTRSIDLEYKK